MNTKLTAVLACAAALALGACSGGTVPGTTGGGGDQPGAGSGTNGGGSNGGAEPDPGGNGGSNGDGEPTALQTAETRYSDAREAAMRAVEAARLAAAGTEAERANAERLIGAASAALDDAVEAADAAVAAAADGSAAQIGAAARASSRARQLRTAQAQALEDARNSLVWYVRRLARYTIRNGVRMPSLTGLDGAPHVTIERIPRTIDRSATDDTQIANPAAFKRDGFKYHAYSAGDIAFSDSGDEFKVDRYFRPQGGLWTYGGSATLVGLRLTDAGLVIRVGTGPGTRADNNSLYFGDQADKRRNITRHVTDANGDGVVDGTANSSDPVGTNGWDLVLTFGEPHTMSVPVGAPGKNLRSSWMGNGDFHWRSIVLPDPSQLEGGKYYAANGFNQPKGLESLGTYEVWLSNHVGTDTNLEPVAGSGQNPHFADDEPHYLKYAAYGMFVYTPDTALFVDGFNGRLGNVVTLPFGYSAFADEDGKRTTDIGTAITSARFHGHTFAYEGRGAPSNGYSGTWRLGRQLLRGDVVLTVSIPKGTGAGTLEGTMTNFQRWSEETGYWTAYIDDGFTVTLNNADISADGTFNGTTALAPAEVRSSFATNGAGRYKGNVYGPRTDSSDLEIAGSWHAGFGNSYTLATITGSFGAKQRPPAAPAN